MAEGMKEAPVKAQAEQESKGVFNSKSMIAAGAEFLCGILVVTGAISLEQAMSLQPFIAGLAIWGLRTAGVPVEGLFGKK